MSSVRQDYEGLLQDHSEDQLLLRAIEESARLYKEVELPRVSQIQQESKQCGSSSECSTSNSIRKNSEENEQTEYVYRGLDENGFDLDAGRKWIYPTNYPIREYQYNIVQNALFKNTLVSLPTGLGKTFIAAVVMYNFYRWYPQGKILFLAPTRPLVAQQIDSCYKVTGIPKEDTAEMTGGVQPKEREVLWKKRRLFFLTPQSLMSDLTRSTCPVQQIRCIVVDEAHKATGNYAYCQVIRAVLPFNQHFRILALSATPGNDMDAVQQVVKNLLIECVEVRDENSVDTKQYTNERTVETFVVKLEGFHKEIQTQYFHILDTYMYPLIKWKLLLSNIKTTTKYTLILARNKFRAHPPAGMSHNTRSQIESDFAMCMSLYHGLELLNLHGLRNFLRYLTGLMEENDNTHAFIRSRLRSNYNFQTMLSNLREKLGDQELKEPDPDRTVSEIMSQVASVTYSHPKMLKLQDVIIQHFKNYEERGEETKVMIFCQYRDTIIEICHVLSQWRPLVKAMSFVGQSSGKLNKGFSQKQQIQIMEKFRRGGYNTLVSTCVGEEGLDIGEVDLIICYDAHASPIRLVQRMGRTGRKRMGKIVMLLTEGKETKKYHQSVSNKNTMNNGLINSKRTLHFNYKCPPMIPEGIEPHCFEMYMTVPKSTKSRNRDVKKMFLQKGRSKDKVAHFIDSIDFEEEDEEMPLCDMLPELENLHALDSDQLKQAFDLPSPIVDLGADIDWLLSDTETINVSRSKAASDLIELLNFSGRKRCNVPLTQTSSIASQICREDLWPTKKRKNSTTHDTAKKKRKKISKSDENCLKKKGQNRLTSLWSNIVASNEDAELMPPPPPPSKTLRKKRSKIVFGDTDMLDIDDYVTILDEHHDDESEDFHCESNITLYSQEVNSTLKNDYVKITSVIDDLNDLENNKFNKCCSFESSFQCKTLSCFFPKPSKEDQALQKSKLQNVASNITKCNNFEDLSSIADYIDNFSLTDHSIKKNVDISCNENFEMDYSYQEKEMSDYVKNDDSMKSCIFSDSFNIESKALLSDHDSKLNNAVLKMIDSNSMENNCMKSTEPSEGINLDKEVASIYEECNEYDEILGKIDVDNIVEKYASSISFNLGISHLLDEINEEEDIKDDENSNLNYCENKININKSVSYEYQSPSGKSDFKKEKSDLSQHNKSPVLGSKWSRKPKSSLSNVSRSGIPPQTAVSFKLNNPEEEMLSQHFTPLTQNEESKPHLEESNQSFASLSNFVDEEILKWITSPDERNTEDAQPLTQKQNSPDKPFCATPLSPIFHDKVLKRNVPNVNTSTPKVCKRSLMLTHTRVDKKPETTSIPGTVTNPIRKTTDDSCVIPVCKQKRVFESDSESDFEDFSKVVKINTDSNFKPSENIEGIKNKEDKKTEPKKSRLFIDDEAEESREDRRDSSDGENTSGLDDLDASFVDDEVTHNSESVDIHAHYLQSVKSPSKHYGRYKLKNMDSPPIDVFSQIIPDEEKNESYEEDSFCVDTEDEAHEESEEDILDIVEAVLAKKRKKSKTTVKQKKKRRRIRVMSSSSEDERPVLETSVMNCNSQSLKPNLNTQINCDSVNYNTSNFFAENDELFIEHRSYNIAEEELKLLKDKNDLKETLDTNKNNFPEDSTYQQQNTKPKFSLKLGSSKKSQNSIGNVNEAHSLGSKDKEVMKNSVSLPIKQIPPVLSRETKEEPSNSDFCNEFEQKFKKNTLDDNLLDDFWDDDVFQKISQLEDADIKNSLKNKDSAKRPSVEVIELDKESPKLQKNDGHNFFTAKKKKFAPMCVKSLFPQKKDQKVLLTDYFSSAGKSSNSTFGNREQNEKKIIEKNISVAKPSTSKENEELSVFEDELYWNEMQKIEQIHSPNKESYQNVKHPDDNCNENVDSKGSIVRSTNALSERTVNKGKTTEYFKDIYENLQKQLQEVQFCEGTSEKESEHLTILVSSRQMVSASEIITALKSQHKIKVHVCFIKVAHYVISTKVAVIRILFGDFCRSSNWTVLLSSVNQLRTLYQQPIVLVEKDCVDSVPANHGDLWSLYSVDFSSRLYSLGVCVVYSESKEFTAAILAKLCQQQHSNGYNIKIPESQNQKMGMQFFEALPGINTALAIDLSFRFKTIADFIKSCKSVTNIHKTLDISRESARQLYFFLQEIIL